MGDGKTHQQALDKVASLRVKAVRERVLERLDLLEGQVLGLAAKRRGAGDELVEDAAERPEVGPGGYGSEETSASGAPSS